MTQALEDLGAHIGASMTNAIVSHHVTLGELTLEVRADQQRLAGVMEER